MRFPSSFPYSATVFESDAVRNEYVKEFTKSGFKGPVKWYRNVDRNFRWNQTLFSTEEKRKSMTSANAVSLGRGPRSTPVLRPEMSVRAAKLLPNSAE